MLILFISKILFRWIHVLTTFVAISLLGLLISCSSMTSVSDNEACIVKLNVPDKLANCGGAYDVIYKYRNPPRPEGNVQYHTLFNQSIADNLIKQEGENHCYAAALESGFSVLGAKHPQVQFARAISEECFGTKDAPLTFSQIVYAATRVHAPPGVWYIDTPSRIISNQMNAISDTLSTISSPGTLPIQSAKMFKPTGTIVEKCQGANGKSSQYWLTFNWDIESWAKRTFLNQANPSVSIPDLTPPDEFIYINQLNLYEPITWHFNDQPPGTVNGAIVPIGNSLNLIDTFYRGVPVIAGLAEENGGHVVLIYKLHIAVIPTGQTNVTRHPAGYISWVEVSDPGNNEIPLRIIPGDNFLANAQFIFAIYQDSRK